MVVFEETEPFVEGLFKKIFHEEKIEVEVGRALIADPQLVLFDEIIAGFNEEEVVNLIELILRENRKGITFCIIGHTMRAIMGVSDWVVVLDEGSNFP